MKGILRSCGDKKRYEVTMGEVTRQEVKQEWEEDKVEVVTRVSHRH